MRSQNVLKRRKKLRTQLIMLDHVSHICVVSHKKFDNRLRLLVITYHLSPSLRCDGITTNNQNLSHRRKPLPNAKKPSPADQASVIFHLPR